MKLPNGDETLHEKPYDFAVNAYGASNPHQVTRIQQENRDKLRALLNLFRGKQVTDMRLLELDNYGDGEAVDQAIKFIFDDGSCVVLLPQDGDSDSRYCTIEVLDTAEFDAHASVMPPIKPAP